MVMLREQIKATLITAHNAGAVRQNRFVDRMIGWENRGLSYAKTLALA